MKKRRASQAELSARAPRRALSLRGWAPQVLAVLLVLAAGGWAYATSLGGAFVFDDFISIVQNPNIRTLWPITRAMSAPLDTTLSGRPIASLTFAINYALAPPNAGGILDLDAAGVTGGTETDFGRSVWGYHVGNIAIHLLAALGLLGVVRRTLLRNRAGPALAHASTGLAATVAALWIVHPLNTEAVTYVVQRVESLMGLFALLSVYCAVRATETPRRWWWTIGALTAYGLALGSKEVAVGVPIVIIAWDFLFHRERWSLYAWLAAISLLLVFTVPGARSRSVGFWLDGWTPWSYLLTQSEVLIHYLTLAIWPSPLVLDPYWPAVRSIAQVIWPFAGLVMLFLATVIGVARRYPVSFAGVWFFAFLAPTSSILPITTEVSAEHRMYLPLAALVSITVIGCYVGVRALLARYAPGRRPTGLRTLTFATVSMAVVLLGWETRARNLDYVSDENIWRDTIRKQPGNPRAHMALGADLVIAGRYQEAMTELEASLAIDPARAETLSNLGLAELKLGKIDDSVAHLQRAITLRPEYLAAHRNLAQAYIARHQDRLAAEHLRLVLDAQPDHVGALKDLALLLAVTSDVAVRNGTEGLQLAERAVTLTSRRDPASLAALAAALAELDRFDEAVTTLREAEALAPPASGLATQLSQLEEAYAARRKMRRPSQ